MGASRMVLEVSKETFGEEVESTQGWTLVDFWGPYCVPCLNLMPHVAALAEKYDHKIKVVKVHASRNRRLCIELKVMGLPTFVLYQNGNGVDRLSGKDVTEAQLEGLVEKHM